MSEPTDEIPIEQRQVIFKAVVEAQDGGQGVAASRAEAARIVDAVAMIWIS